MFNRIIMVHEPNIIYAEGANFHMVNYLKLNIEHRQNKICRHISVEIIYRTIIKPL